MFLANNSAIFISDIGNTENRLQCITDRMPCCITPDRVGEWYFPGGGMVQPIASTPTPTTFFRDRGDDGTVNLNRVSNDVVMPTGQYCCEVLDATGVNRTACAIICECVCIKSSSKFII